MGAKRVHTAALFKERKYGVSNSNSAADRARQVDRCRGLETSSKTSGLSQLPTVCWLQTSPGHLSVQKRIITWFLLGMDGGIEYIQMKVRGESGESDGGTSGEKLAMCLCECKIGKEANEKAESQKQGDTDTKSLQSVQNSPAATLLICYHSN